MKTKKIKQDPKVKELEKLVDELMSSNTLLRNDKNRLEGRLTRFEEEEEARKESEQSEVRMLRRKSEDLEDQVRWLRNLVEKVVLPADKLKLLKEDITITNEFHPDYVGIRR